MKRTDGDGDGDFEETYSWTAGKLDSCEDHEAARPSTVRWGIEWDGDHPVRREVLRWGELERAEERRWADGHIQEITTDEDGDGTPDAVETWVWSYD